MTHLITVGTYNGGLQGWTFDASGNMEIKFSFAAHDASVKSMSSGLHENKSLLASGGSDEVIRVYDVNTGVEVTTLMKHGASVTAIDFAANFDTMLTGSEKGDIIIWRMSDWRALHTLGGHKSAINGIAIHPSGKLALSVSKDKTLRMWNLVEGRMSFIMKLSFEAEQILWSPNGDNYGILADKTITLYQVSSGSILATVTYTSRIASFSWINDELFAAVGEGKVICLNNIKGEVIHIAVTLADIRLRCISSIAMEGFENPFLVTATTSGLVQVWNPTKWIEEGNEGSVESMSVIDEAFVCSSKLSEGHRVVTLTAQKLSINNGDEEEKGIEMKKKNVKNLKKRKQSSNNDENSEGSLKKKKVEVKSSSTSLVPKAKVIVESDDKPSSSNAVKNISRTKLQNALNFARYGKKGGGGKGNFKPNKNNNKSKKSPGKNKN